MIEKMTKYSFVLLSGKAEDFLTRLESLGLVDVTRSTKPVDEKSSELFTSVGEIRKAVGKLSQADWSKDPDLERIEAAACDREFKDLPGSVSKAFARLETLMSEMAAARKACEAVRPWGRFDRQALDSLSAEGLKVRWYNVSKKKYDPSWAALQPLVEVSDNGSRVWFVTVSDDPEYSFPAEECPAPEGDLDFMQRKIESLREETIACKGEILALKKHLPELEEMAAAEEARLQRYLAEAGSGKAAENLVTTFVGFAPSDKDSYLCPEFDGMDVVYIKEDATKEDNPPIKMKGNWFTRLFSVLTDMYGRPVYDEFDPTPYISIFFTLFFAMCMGDAGYGLVLLLLGVLASRSKGSLAKFAPLVTILGGATFVMGIIFHMFFGIDISQVSWVPSWLKKCMITGTVMGYDAQMLFSIGIGVLHLCVAFILKAVYSVKRNGWGGSLATLGWTLLIVGGVMVGGFALLGVIGSSITKWIIIVIGILSALGIFFLNDLHRNPLANFGLGLYDTYNTATGLLGDVLSYLRLYALGLAGGMLGSAFNSLGTSCLGISIPGVGIACCLLIVVFGHVLNLAMCCLGAFVHPLRLNFLEFFKNSGYEGSGRAYSPLTTGSQESE